MIKIGFRMQKEYITFQTVNWKMQMNPDANEQHLTSMIKSRHI